MSWQGEGMYEDGRWYVAIRGSLHNVYGMWLDAINGERDVIWQRELLWWWEWERPQQRAKACDAGIDSLKRELAGGKSYDVNTFNAEGRVVSQQWRTDYHRAWMDHVLEAKNQWTAEKRKWRVWLEYAEAQAEEYARKWGVHLCDRCGTLLVVGGYHRCHNEIYMDEEGYLDGSEICISGRRIDSETIREQDERLADYHRSHCKAR